MALYYLILLYCLLQTTVVYAQKIFFDFTKPNSKVLSKCAELC